MATARGRFVVRVRADVNDCAGFSATAVGNKGTRATLKRAPGQCPTCPRATYRCDVIPAGSSSAVSPEAPGSSYHE